MAFPTTELFPAAVFPPRRILRCPHVNPLSNARGLSVGCLMQAVAGAARADRRGEGLERWWRWFWRRAGTPARPIPGRPFQSIGRPPRLIDGPLLINGQPLRGGRLPPARRESGRLPVWDPWEGAWCRLAARSVEAVTAKNAARAASNNGSMNRSAMANAVAAAGARPTVLCAQASLASIPPPGGNGPASRCAKWLISMSRPLRFSRPDRKFPA